MISIIVLTYNDECQLAYCLESVRALSDDIVCVDSFSTDRTVEIAKSYGARVYQNPFVNQATQFNWALDNVPLKYEWVFRLDSDEVVPTPLATEIRARVGKEPGIVAYEINRAIYWMGRKLRWGRMYPHYIVRIFKKDCGRYELRTEEHLVVSGPVGRMKNEFYEDNKKNTLAYFTEKHLVTARGEVEELLRGVRSDAPGELAVKPSLFGTKVQRTRWLKEKLYNRMPLFVRPLLYFLYRYIVCLGFLDGRPGLVFHVLQGFWYRFYIDACVLERAMIAARKSREGRD